MKDRLQKELNEYYEAPKPLRKQAFIRQFGVERMDYKDLIRMQAGYISKWVWIFSLLLCGGMYWSACMLGGKGVRVVAGLAPFLVMVSVTESARSFRYRMEELERSARFSLKSIVMARLLLLGAVNAAVLSGVFVLLGKQPEYCIFQILAPYFLTAGGSLLIVRKIRGTENIFFCFALSSFVAMLQILFPWNLRQIFLPAYAPVWLTLCAAGILFTIWEGKKMIRMTEDLAWN